jgi:hypothetical protein
MKALVRKQSLNDTFTRKHIGTKQTPVLKITNMSVSPAGYTPLQRKPICPCDGGCPRCASVIQTKLTIGQPNDKYEQEADRVADEVMRMSEPEVQPKPT